MRFAGSRFITPLASLAVCVLALVVGGGTLAFAGPTSPLATTDAGGGTGSVATSESTRNLEQLVVFISLNDNPWDSNYMPYVKLGRALKVTGGAVCLSSNASGSLVKFRVKREQGASWVTVKTASVNLSPMETFHWKYWPTKKGSYCVRASMAANTKHTGDASPWEPFRVK